MFVWEAKLNPTIAIEPIAIVARRAARKNLGEIFSVQRG